MVMENWGKPGMPPFYVDVAGRETIAEGDNFRKEARYIKGVFSFGFQIINFEDDIETVVICIIDENGEMRIKQVPDIDVLRYIALHGGQLA
jgi:hypothetical protein